MRTSRGGEGANSLSRGSRVGAVVGATFLCFRLLLWSLELPLRELHGELFDGVSPAGGWTLDRLVVDAAAVGLLVVASVLAGFVAVTIVGAGCASISPRVDALAARITPSFIRRAVFTLCGLALTTPGLSSAAHADDSGSPGSPRGDHRPAVAGLPLPDLPSAHRSRAVTVQPGDSLWLIARRALPPHASDSAVATRVALLYAENRRTIGNNPDLIFPGQQLIATGGS